MGGRPLNRRNPIIGYVPQKVFFDPDMPLRARDVVGLGLDGHRLGIPLGWGGRRQAVDRMLEAVDARHFADARVGNLSGGEQQRVLIAHALISRPRLLLLDEPLANLDIRAEGEVVALLARIAREQRIAVLISAHDVNPLLPVMDRLVYVAAGRTASGTTEEVIRAEVLSALYGQHVDVLRVHGRILVVSGAEGASGVTLEETDAAPGPGPTPSRWAMSQVLNALFAPGFFASGPVRAALVVGAVVALVTGAVGVFTVIRGQAFAGHALGEVGSAGGSARLPGRRQPALGLHGDRGGRRGAHRAAGLHRPRARDVATGLVLGAGLGLAALFLYLDTTSSSTTGVSVTILFGSLFAISQPMLPSIVALSAIALVVIASCYRMLLLSSLSPDLAAARGVPVRAVALAYLVIMAVAVSLAAETIGTILATALSSGRPPPRCGSPSGREGPWPLPAWSASPPCGSGSCSPTTASTGHPSTTAGRSASSWSRMVFVALPGRGVRWRRWAGRAATGGGSALRRGREQLRADVARRRRLGGGRRDVLGLHGRHLDRREHGGGDRRRGGFLRRCCAAPRSSPTPSRTAPSGGPPAPSSSARTRSRGSASSRSAEPWASAG